AAAVIGSTTGAASAAGSGAGVSIAAGAVPVAGVSGGDSTLGSSLLTGDGASSGFAAVSPPVMSIFLRLAMTGPRFGCLPSANHVSLPIGYHRHARRVPPRASQPNFPDALDRQIKAPDRFRPPVP